MPKTKPMSPQRVAALSLEVVAVLDEAPFGTDDNSWVAACQTALGGALAAVTMMGALRALDQEPGGTPDMRVILSTIDLVCDGVKTFVKDSLEDWEGETPASTLELIDILDGVNM